MAALKVVAAPVLTGERPLRTMVLPVMLVLTTSRSMASSFQAASVGAGEGGQLLQHQTLPGQQPQQGEHGSIPSCLDEQPAK
jgi:hypothetical protein